MSGAPLFTLVIFMKVDNISSLLMFVLTFVLFFNLFTLVIFMKVARQYFITLLMLVLNFAF